MTTLKSTSANHNFKIFLASLLAYLMLTTQLAPLALAAGKSPVRSAAPPAGKDASRPTESRSADLNNANLNAPIPAPAPPPFAPVIVATMDDGIPAATTVAPGGAITYTVTINNNGAVSPADDALNVIFSNTIDAHTTLVAGSPVAAVSDNYNTIGNVQISVPAPGLLTNDFDPETGNNAGMTATAQTKSSTNCTGGCSNNVTINANGNFTYDPPIGFSGTDTFTYTANSGTATATTTVKIVVANEIWFINNNAGACASNCDGRLSHPFQSLAAFNAANLNGAGQPGDNDWIFVYESATAYTGPTALRLGQKFIGQDATTSLTTLTGFSQPSGTNPLPVMNSANGTIVNITTSVAATNGINLNSGNTLRGFTVGNTTGAKISGTNFGTLIVGDSALPDVTLNGTGQALSLTTGTLSNAGKFVSVTTTSSTAQGISLAGVADSDGAGPGSFSFGSTSVSGSTSQGILIGTTTADLNLGNTSITGGTSGISFQNNSAGTRTTGTLNVSGGSANAFLHGTAGGNVTITGAATLSSANSAVSVSAPGATNVINFQAATSATSSGAGNTAVSWAGVAGASITFNSLTIQRNNATALSATGGGTVNVTNNTGSINNTTAGGSAIVANGVALNANFSQINSTAGTNGVSLTGVSGTSSFGAGSLTGTATGPTFLVSGGTCSVTYSGGITQAANNAMVSILGTHQTGTITFQTGTLSATNGTGLQFNDADGIYNFNGTTTLNGGDAGIDILNGSGGTFSFGTGTAITNPSGTCFTHNGSTAAVTFSGNITKSANPSAGLLVDITNQASGTITFQTGTLSSTGNSGTGIQLSNADGTVNFNGTTTLNGGDAGIDILNGSGGTFTFSTGTAITSPSGIAFNVGTSPGNPTVTYSGSITQNNGSRVVNIDGTTGNTITFQTGTITGGANSTGININNANGNVTFSNGMTLGTSGSRMTNQAVTITNGGSSATYSLGAMSIFTNNAKGLVATNADGTINCASTSTVDSSNATAIDIDGPAGLTTLGMTLVSVNSAGGTADGISIQDTNGSFTVAGDGSTTTQGGNNTGGTISGKNGADNNNTQGIGVFLSNVTNITLRRMHLQNNQNYAIFGNSVTAFKFQYSTIDGTNGNNILADGEDAIQINNLFGTGATDNALTNDIIKGAWRDNVHIHNTSATNSNLATPDKLTITGCLIRDTNTGSNGNDNVHIRSEVSANIKVDVTNNTFAATNGDHVQTITSDQAKLQIVVTGNALSGGGSVANALLQGITISGGTATPVDSTETVRFNISNNGTSLNPMTGTIQGGAININEGSGNGDWQGQVSNNFVGNAGVNCSGATQSSGIRFENHSKGTLTGIVSNNTVRQACGAGGGISTSAGDNTASGLGNGPMNLTITGNSVILPAGAAAPFSDDHGITMIAGNLSGNTNQVCVDFQNDTATGNTAATTSGKGFRIRQRFQSTVRMPGYTGAAQSPNAPADVRTYILGRGNVGTGDATSAPSDVSVTVQTVAPLGGGFLNTSPAGSQCVQPSVPVVGFNLAPQSNKEQFARILGESDTRVGESLISSLRADSTYNSILEVATVPQVEEKRVASDDASQIATRTGTAETKAGAVQSLVSRVASLRNSLSSFVGAIVGMVEPTAHAAEDAGVMSREGRSDAMFIAPADASARKLRRSGRAAVVDQKSDIRSNHARSSKLVTRNSKLASAPALMSGETVTANIGTLPAGGSVTIAYQVTVNNPPNLSLLGPPRVSNQGQVSGLNFATVQTDDPNVGGASDPTVTLINLFDTTTSLVSNLNPSNTGDQVTFTATINETPPQGTADPTGTVNFIDTSNGNAVICSNVALSAGSAQCQTSSLTAGTHNIRADYSGDGNFDPSQSTLLAQVVNACTPNPIVTSTADSGAGTLRDALTNACSAPNNVITFNIAGPGPHTISLTSAELAVTKNVTINNNSGESITVSGNNARRVFNINSGKTASIIGLTISGGAAASGAGVLNDGTLTLVNSTLTGNNATADGGGISTSASATSSTLINTTISGNNANGNGGGVAVLGGTMTSINSTITNNRADNDNNATGTGGGIAASAGTTTLKNTIVAGNFNEDGASDAADDISGTVDPASSFNLIGTGGAGGLTNGVNSNQVGVASPGLGALASNGGLTQTHALLSTSPAIEAGSNANLPADTFDLDGDANTAETLPVDQRGTGFPRTADSADANLVQTVDIGAFELHPSIEDIANQTTAEDTAKLVTFNLGDDTGALISTVTATSSNTTLVTSDGAHLSFTGSGGSRTLTITPNTNANSPTNGGTTTITVTVTATNGRTAVDTFDLTVTEVNDNPDAVNDTLPAIDEDSGLRVIPFANLLVNDNAGPNESGQTITVTNVSNPVGGTVAINGTNIEFTPTANFFGSASFDYTITDNGTTNGVPDPKGDTATASFTINPINDPPSFTIAGNPPAVPQDAGPQTVLNFATSISAGPGETGQTLTFNLSPTGTTGTLTFSTAPAINSTTGTLTYTATNGTNGTATFNVTLSDNGSNTPPNSNTSGAQSFTITVNSPNASPVVTTTAGNLAYTENAGAVAIDPGLTVTDSDNTDLTGASVSITAGFVSAQDTLAFTNQLGITGTYNSGTGLLTLTGTTTVANYQTALRSVTYANSSDNPTTSRTITFNATDGISTPGTATRGIAITAVNDAPVNTVPGPQSTNEDTAKVFSSGNGNQISVADVDLGANPIKITLTATNGTLTLSTTAGLSFITGDGTADATMMFTGALAAVNTALNGLSFTPTLDFNGAASLQIVSDDQGNTGTGGPLTDTDTVNITVNATNDPPVVTTTAGNLSYTENDAATAIDPGLTVTDVDNANLVGATVAITAGFVSAQDTLAFTNQNGITGNYNSGTGVLTLTGTSSVANYQTALRSVTYQNSSDNPTASRTVTFTADDGSSTSTPATRGITINAVNDAPVNTVPGPQTTSPNTPLTFSSGGGNLISIADVDAGTNPVQVTLTASNGTLTLNGTAGLNFGCGGCSGDGTADASMTFQGTITNINTALNGMVFTPTNGFGGTAGLTITTNDLGNTGTGGPLTDSDSVTIQVSTNVRILDAKLAEPTSGSTNMLFTITLSNPAPSNLSVDFATAAGGANPATPGSDFSPLSGSVFFLAGERIKTLPITILSDADNSETDETLLVNLTGASGATIVDSQATGTITVANPPSTFVISELRTSGPAGLGDDFVELYNNTDTQLTVAASDASAGYGLFAKSTDCDATPILIGIIPNGTVIPARGHYLFVGSQYSLTPYAAGDATLSSDILTDSSVAIFNTADINNVSTVTRLDAVGFGPNMGGGVCGLLVESNSLPALGVSTMEGSYQRDQCGKLAQSGIFGNCPTGGLLKDSNNNVQDFFWADTQGNNTPAGQHLGAPGPENLGSPIVRNAPLPMLLIDATKAATVDPNRERILTPVTNGSQGTLTLRRRIRNDTGAPVTRLRFRIIDLSTFPITAGIADMRALTSVDISKSGVLDPQTCAAEPGSPAPPCIVTIRGTTVEAPPAQPNGGATNSTFGVGVITLGTPLPAGASVNVQWVFGLQSTGSFKFFVNVEALP